MEISLTIKYLHPTLEFWVDYVVLNDWKEWDSDYIKWYNTDITQPTQAELESAWIELQEKENKLLIVKEYKNIQTQIVGIKQELQEIEDTYATYNEQWKQIADLQKTNLNNKLTDLRTRKDTLVLDWVEKFGTDIINEL